MLNNMPLKFIKNHSTGRSIDLNTFFGFVKVNVKLPQTVDRPLIPFKHKGRTIYPTGSWTGVYFTPELRKAKELIPQYEYEVLSGMEFSEAKIFDKYVLDMYRVKSTTKGAERWIAKLLLNCLYGGFGRTKDITRVVNIHKADLIDYVANFSVKSIIPITGNIYTLIIEDGINAKPAKLPNLKNDQVSGSATVEVDNLISVNTDKVRNNVAIASAITSYARIVMMPFKLDPSCAYSDTDSLFTQDVLKLLEKLISSTELGMFKDELNGSVIEEATFLGIKQYGYWYLEKGVRIEKSVFAGAPRNSISYEDIQSMLTGKIFNINLKPRFNKSLTDLSIKIKPASITIKQNNHKQLVDNKYIPPHVNLNNTSNNFIIKTLKNLRLKIKNYKSLINILLKY